MDQWAPLVSRSHVASCTQAAATRESWRRCFGDSKQHGILRQVKLRGLENSNQ